MKAPLTGLLTLFLLTGCAQLPKSYLGIWEGDDTPTLGIMNRLNITDSTISFGNGENINKPVVCKASYKAEEKKNGQYLLKLKDKACDYAKAMNPEYLREMASFTIYLSKNPFGTKSPFSDKADTHKTPYLFIRSEAGSTDYRFSRVE
ncbi:hypothetical protein [Endozoicomonas numazuensis]|uniref:Lipoprotein n=1 Tax=Endozoicomonas numazuensis TaxID=1137799 RepID=A0A081NCQ4_9GAMM|nr:hypothetical protein [Endozoicomonas numazuensis]KEQ16227.1 hypothetical protein GZ78_23670 [Endozoicomonas numazuensis]